PDSASPLDAVAAGLDAVGDVLEPRRAYARQRYAVICQHAELLERELLKLANLSAAIADALRRRGVADPVADLTAEIGVAIFKTGFERWATGSDDHLTHHTGEALSELAALVTGIKAPVAT